MPDTNPFSDTEDPIILKAYNAGIVLGIGSGLFAPYRTITRAELAVMLQRTIAVSDPEKYNKFTVNPSDYHDNTDIRSWARDAIDFVTSAGIMQGSNNRFNPTARTTCEQAILTNYRSWLAVK
jgi:hypothetical protein